MGLFKRKKPHTPREAKESGRSQQFVRIVEVISEGEIQGLVAGEQSVFLDNTPLKNADGSYNFQNVIVDGEAGTQNQPVMNGFDSSEKEIAVGTEVRKRTPLTRTVTDPNVSRLRLTLGVSSLFEQAENGDTNGSQVDFVIRIGSQSHNLSINGKYSSQYLRSVIIDQLPPVPFQIRVERVQADSTSQRLQNKTLWASYTEIIDTPFAYPNTALMGVKFDSEYFSQIPTRSYDLYGIKVQVPSNYDPATRTYNGVWNGTFKREYSNNPVWVLMDIVTNKRYGLGKRLGEFGVDKWALYQVAQYCDQKIPDGFGGTEPRFTCNVWLTEQRAAYDVINDICSIFRAMPVWNGTELTVIMDRPSDPVWTYTNANVINGEFSRQYSAVKARHNAIQVEYQDASNNYEKAIEYVSDDDAIRKYGLNLKKVVAFGCTSRGQAYRTGRWILETERLETETITFSVGSEGLMHLPGDIIRVSDNHYAGTAIGGRVVAISGRTVTLDREIQLHGNSVFSFINAQAKHSHIRIQSVRGKTITLASQPTGLTGNSVWSLSTQQVTSRLYRAMSIAENDNGGYTITALQHEPQKEAIVDNGAVFEPIATTVHRPPQVEHLDVDLAGGNATFNWQSTTGEGSVAYDVRVLKGEKLYAFHKGLTSLTLALDDLPDGDYTVIIIAKNARGQILSEKRKTFTVNRPPVPKNVSVMGGLSEISLSWDYVDDVTQTEIWASDRNDIRTAKRVAKVLASFYSHTVGARQTRYYWLRHIRGQNRGAFSQQAGIQAQSGEDVDEEIRLLNEKLSEPIINKVFDVAAPARGLELVKTVANLTNRRTFLNAKLVFNSADNKLYTWNGREYTEKIPVGDIHGLVPTWKLSGQLRDEQIQSLNTGKLTGNIPKERLDQTLVADVSKALRDVAKESRDRATALQTEARERGTAVRALQNTTQEQAQLINQATATSADALAAVRAEQLARTTAEQATATQFEQLTARLDDRTLIDNNLIEYALTFDTSGNLRPNGNVGFGEKQSTRYQGSVVYKTTRNWQGLFLQQEPVTTPVVLSFWAKADGDSCKFKTQVGNRHHQLSDNGVIRGDWKLYSITFPNGTSFYNSAGQGFLEFYHGRAYYALIKLEHGTEPTAFGTSLKDAIAQAQADIVSERVARVEGDEATTQTVESLTQRTEQAEGAINDVRSSKANKDEVATLASQTLRSEWQNDAQTKANLAKEQAIARASQDAQDKANAAKAQAIADAAEKDKVLKQQAAQDAQAKADAVKRIADEAQRAANQAKADIVTEQQARTTAIDAIARQTTTLSTRLDDAESVVEQQSQTLTSLDGTVQSLHTIRAQTISGNHKAVSGISLGSAGGVTSSIIFMADRTQFVENAQDGNPKTLLTVADGKLALNGDFLANGMVQAKHLDANSVTTGAIKAGAIRADHLAAGQISADKLAIGLGGNLLTNPIFSNVQSDGLPHSYGKWASATALNFRAMTGQEADAWGLKHYLPNENQLIARIDGDARASATVSSAYVPINAGHWYMLSAFMGIHRGRTVLTARCVKEDGSYQDFNSESVSSQYSFNGGLTGSTKRAFVKFKAPPNTVKMCVLFWIISVDNHKNKQLRVARPMLEECTEHTQEPSPWQNAGVTSIHGGSIVTNSITAQQIAANTITGNELVAGTISSRHIATNTIGAAHIQSRAISAEKLNVSSLSAISSNIGTVTAGTIRGTTISGGTITGATISGGTITGVHFSGVTGNFSGALKVTELIGGGIIDQVVGKLRQVRTESVSIRYEVDRGDRTYSMDTSVDVPVYQATVSIAASGVDRYISVDNEKGFILKAGETHSVTITRKGSYRNNGADSYAIDLAEERKYVLVLAYAVSKSSTITVS